MEARQNTLSAEFSKTGGTVELSLSEFSSRTVEFLEHYGTPYLLGEGFCDIIGSGSGEEKLIRLMRAAGFENDLLSFFEAVVHPLAESESDNQKHFVMNGVELPQLLKLCWLEMMVPGLSKDDIRVQVDNGILTVKYELENEEEEKKESWVSREFYSRGFSRRFKLSSRLAPEKITASYNNGILVLSIPKKEEAKPKPVQEIEIA